MPLHVALIQPQIPPNTGNIARLCAATDSSLHLIEPLGFRISDAEVRRAGLDYWDAVDLWIHPNWFAFRDAMDRNRCLYFSAKAARSFWEAPYRTNSCLVFGSETEGMPQRILEKHPERCFTIPMAGPVRSLNLANAVSIVLYEAIRQVSGQSVASRQRPAGRESRVASHEPARDVPHPQHSETSVPPPFSE
ncbi:MAG TPA: tRNA (cytidine(34)-2'-O)-methyltransferase [Gemmatimonadales bacterium]|nr:tRNA (cytidine(34)-2'-O)-methyltransferase [Gemmatimonadales bacterium]